MNIIYYLHTNGDLIVKVDHPGVDADMRESDFVVMYWRMNDQDRLSAWNLLVEALAVGAKAERINELAAKWGCDDVDADTYAKCIAVDINLDGNRWCATAPRFINQMESPAGFGDTKLEAISRLCEAVGYKAQKMWGATFQEILKKRAA